MQKTNLAKVRGTTSHGGHQFWSIQFRELSGQKSVRKNRKKKRRITICHPYRVEGSIIQNYSNTGISAIPVIKTGGIDRRVTFNPQYRLDNETEVYKTKEKNDKLRHLHQNQDNATE